MAEEATQANAVEQGREGGNPFTGVPGTRGYKDSAMRRAEEIRRHREAMAEIGREEGGHPRSGGADTLPPPPRKQGPPLKNHAEEEVELPRRLDHNGQPWSANPRHRIEDLIRGVPDIVSSEPVHAYIKERLALGQFPALVSYLEDEILLALSTPGHEQDAQRVAQALEIARSTIKKEIG